MLKKIALEEHFIHPDLLHYCIDSMPDLGKSKQEMIIKALSDFDKMRLRAMDDASIEYAVLSLSGPGVQAEPDTKKAIHLAKHSNERLAETIAEYSSRYGGFAHLPMQSPKDAADELEHCVNTLGFIGAMVNGHTLGIYLDAPQYDIFWERLEVLDVPLYLHPTDSWIKPFVIQDTKELYKCTWEWNFETSSHFLRLLYAGVFDRFPKLKIILGHMGEMLPFELWRLDSRTALLNNPRPLLKSPSEYLKTNLYITTSGVCDDAPLLCSLLALGEDKVLFSTDYPYESVSVASDWIENANITDEVRQKVCFTNAKRLLRC